MSHSVLWIEVPTGAVSGGSGSQIDIPNDAARAFFGLEPGVPFHEKILVYHGARLKKKVLDWRGSEAGNKQFRLNLLTRAQGGPATYANRVLVVELLSRQPIEISTQSFDCNDPRVTALRLASERAGTMWETLPGQPSSRRWGLSEM